MTLLEAEKLAEIRAGYDPRPEASASLHVSCYRDPAILEIERDAIFKRSWQFLCHAEKLREVGDYVAAEVQGQSIFAARGDDRALRAFYNVCKHRAHELVQGAGAHRPG